MDSILTSIKKLLGIPEEYNHFDTDVIIHINSALLTVTQLGIGPSNGFSITGSEETWADLISDDLDIQLNAVISLVYLKVKLLFDPNALSGTVVESMNRQIAELENRIIIAVETAAENN